MQHFPSGGEVVIIDRSWYNRAGVEYVMGFCSTAEHRRFLDLCPQIEKYVVDGGMEVGMDEQERRFKSRIEDPVRQWKLSPMDIESYRRWYDYSRARDLMFKGDEFNARAMAPHPFRRQAPARLNCIAHLLKVIPTSVYRVIGFGCQGAPTRDATTIKSPCEE